MEHIIWIMLVVALALVLGVLLVGVLAFVRGGEFNRRYGTKLLFLRSAMGGLALVLLGVLALMHGSLSKGH